jgi:hypothetical protein
VSVAKKGRCSEREVYLLLDERVLLNTLDGDHRKFELSVSTNEEVEVVTVRE